MAWVLDTGFGTDYHHSPHGRVKVPVGLLDFKNDSGKKGDARILPFWTASGFLFLHLPILMVLSRLG